MRYYGKVLIYEKSATKVEYELTTCNPEEISLRCFSWKNRMVSLSNKAECQLANGRYEETSV